MPSPFAYRPPVSTTTTTTGLNGHAQSGNKDAVTKTAPSAKAQSKQQQQEEEENTGSLTWLDFEDGKMAFRYRTNWELMRAWGIFKLCSYPWLVRHSRSLIAASDAVAGKRLTTWGLRNTFFAHFCAGESQEELLPILDRLRAAGVGAILDYAAEADAPTSAKAQQQQQLNEQRQKAAQAREQLQKEGPVTPFPYPSTPMSPAGLPTPAHFFRVSTSHPQGPHTQILLCNGQKNFGLSFRFVFP